MNKSWFPIVVAVVVTLLLCGIVLLLTVTPKRTAIVISTGEPKPDLVYEIYGAINDPGIYHSSSDLRVSTAVALAGGFTDEADIERSRSSVWIIDGDTIIVPTLGEFEPTLTLSAPGVERIDLNTADVEMLDQLPGIGEKKAQDIISLREQKNGFTSVDDLLEVDGINENTLNKFYDMVFVSRSQEEE